MGVSLVVALFVSWPRSAGAQAPAPMPPYVQQSVQASRSANASQDRAPVANKAPSTPTAAEPPAPAPPKGESGTASAPAELGWPRLFAVHVGSTTTPADRRALHTSQIAARGSMVVVASRGEVGRSDPLDGVYVINGKDGLGAERLPVLHIPSPQRPNQDEGATDAIGVLLDGDFVVFGTYGGSVTKVRLDGRVAWAKNELPPGTRPALPALFDVNSDGVLDVVVPVNPTVPCEAPNACGAAWAAIAVALDGRDGHVLWRAADPQWARVPDLAETGRSSLVTGREPAIGIRSCPGTTQNLGRTWSRGSVELAFVNGQVTISDSLPVCDANVELSVNGLADGRLESQGQQLVLAGQSGRTDLYQATLSLPGLAESPPTIADVNLDGKWDVLVVSQGMLVAFSTDLDGDVARPFWRGDLAGTGIAPPIDSPKAYASRVGPRDEKRWLRPPRALPEKSSFQDRGTLLEWVKKSSAQIDTGTLPLPGYVEEPADLPPVGSDRAATARELTCSDRRYGLNEGSLVIREGSQWHLAAEAPWPVIGMSCGDGELFIASPDGHLFSLAPPRPWISTAFAVVVIVFLLTFALGWAVHQAGPPFAQDEETELVRQVVVSDEPRSRREDALPAQERLVSGLMHMLDNDETRPPVTLALYGAWGSGKSSVMQMLRSELASTGRYIHVWFNAWRFHREKELAAALLQTIVAAIAEQSEWVTKILVMLDRTRRASLRDIFFVAAPAIIVVFMLAVCVRSAFTTANQNGVIGAIVSVVLLGTGVWRKLVGPFLKVFSLEPGKLFSAKDSEQRIAFVRQFAGEFQRVMGKLPRDRRLVVFVDDLDRCPPDRIVDLLETLSMLADTGCGFFVLGIDPVTVRRAVELSYRDMIDIMRKENPSEADRFGWRYLEKMITLGVNVPQLSASDIDPDQRIAPKAPEPSPFAWSRYLPSFGWLVAGFFAVALGWGTYRLSGVVGAEDGPLAGVTMLLDGAGRVFAQPAEHSAKTTEATPPAAASAHSGAPTAPTVDTASGPAGVAAQTRKLASLSPSTRTAAPSASVARAPELAPPPPLVVIETPAKETPTQTRTLAATLWYASLIVGTVAVLVLAALFWAHRVQVSRMRKAKPRAHDAKLFKEDLDRSKAHLPANPRNVVRFTNVARFLFQVLSASGDARKNAGWEQSFFPLFVARWTGQKDPAACDWLRAELEAWLPAAQQAPRYGSTTVALAPMTVPPSAGNRTEPANEIRPTSGSSGTIATSDRTENDGPASISSSRS